MRSRPLQFRISVVLIVLFAFTAAHDPKADSDFNLSGLASLPVMQDGRIQPLDTAARNGLLLLSSKSKLRGEGAEKPGSSAAISWLSELLFRPEAADDIPCIRIDNNDLKDALTLPEEQKNFSFNDFRNSLESIESQTTPLHDIEPQNRSSYERAMVQLYERLVYYTGLRNSIWLYDQESISGEWKQFEQILTNGSESNPALINLFQQRYARMAQLSRLQLIPDASSSMVKMGVAQLQSIESGEPNQWVYAYLTLAEAYRSGDVAAFNAQISALTRTLSEWPPANKVALETSYNRFNPLYRSMLCYLLAVLLILVSWMRWNEPLTRTAVVAIVVGWLLHTGGLVARMHIQGRPPVTNLYSSAVFVGWGGAVFGLIAEKWHRRGLCALTAATIGFVTLLVAQGLAVEGDTLEQMQAVLDSNFWLSTHVVTITLGYAATFLAGAIGIVYLLRKSLGKLDRKAESQLSNLAFGVICFALLLSFVGTVLGGIWADQSWGRFWGWDPKENGALMIVIWNAAILHARLAGMLRAHGILLASIFGNIITAFSWFGVNMLGVGLHSYGFMEEAFLWLISFCVSQLLLIGWGIWIEKRLPVSGTLIEKNSG